MTRAVRKCVRHRNRERLAPSVGNGGWTQPALRNSRSESPWLARRTRLTRLVLLPFPCLPKHISCSASRELSRRLCRFSWRKVSQFAIFLQPLTQSSCLLYSSNDDPIATSDESPDANWYLPFKTVDHSVVTRIRERIDASTGPQVGMSICSSCTFR
jgi:hypothetical protein